TLSAEAAKAGEALDGFGEAFSARLIDNLSGTEARLGDRADAIAGRLGEIESRLTGELGSIEARIANTASRTSETLAGHSEAFAASVADNLAGTES
ncbi:hypothetical protein LNK20_20170, partial [Bacillus safensis]|nr:hypothetical protein [Bacillus safensis]